MTKNVKILAGGGIMTIQEALKKGTIELKTKGIEEPKMKARLLMQHVLNKPREYLVIYDKKELSQNESTRYFENINKIVKGIPVQHITHQQEFMKMNFYVDNNVLIPRADTEILVEEVIKIAQKINARKILDMCTGSGAIAVSLAKYLPKAQITAIDVSEKALKIAKKNARTNAVENQITFVLSNLFENLQKEKYDIIVSNPPYIKKEELKILDKEVKKEPMLALDGGIDGLDFYKAILKQNDDYLKFGGYLCFEIGYNQKEDVTDLIKKEEKYIDIYSKKDLLGNDRIVVAKRN